MIRDEDRDSFKNTLIRINDQHYTTDFDYTDFKKGDVVLDKKDFTHGVIIQIYGDSNEWASVGEGFAAELGIKISRLIKLNKIISEKLETVNVNTGVFELEN